jgi:hypothetical protein
MNSAPAAVTEWRYAVYGHNLHAAFPFNGLPPCAEQTAAIGEVVVRMGAVPLHLDEAPLAKPTIEVSPHAVLLKPRVDGRDLGRILVRGGREIRLAPETGVPLAPLQAFILGSGMGAVCFQNGLLPLHASAVSSSSGAIAFAGDAGAGKSTMASALAARGLAPLADDVSVIQLAHGAVVYPGPPVTRLAADSSCALGFPAPAEAAISRGDKVQYRNPSPATANEPKSLRAIYLLELCAAGGPEIEPVTGQHAAAALASQIYRHAWLGPMNLLEARIRDVAILARRVPCFRLRRLHRFDLLPEVVDLVLRHRAEAAA